MNPLRPRPSPLLNRLLLAFSHGARPTAVATIPGARHASTEAVLPAAVAATVSTVPAVQGEAQQTQKQGGRRSRAIPPPGHGERIWIYNHLTANYIVYSLTPEMNVRTILTLPPPQHVPLLSAIPRPPYHTD